jgi:hypothetical protein
MKKSITITLSDEELMELQRIILDEDKETALCFLEVPAVIALAGYIVSWWREWLAGTLLIVTSFGVLINPVFNRYYYLMYHFLTGPH